MKALPPNTTNVEFTKSINRGNSALDTGNNELELSNFMDESHRNLFSNETITISARHLSQMQEIIAAVEKVVTMPSWKSRMLGVKVNSFVPENKGVFFGYDFHLNNEGAHLIEINTNAGGAFFNILAQQNLSKEKHSEEFLAPAEFEKAIMEMFLHEWKLQRGSAFLRSIAIVDESPKDQYFYPEFVLAKQLFERHGLLVFIADPSNFSLREDGLYCEENKVDLIYNRLTDFTLAQFPTLLTAYQQNKVVLTPHPYAYALYADKSNLAVLTDGAFLGSIGIDDPTVKTLLAGIPQTRLVDEKDADKWWKERKEWFFKPTTGFGGKGSYRGAKLTHRVFVEILNGNYVAQRLVAPGEHYLSVDSEKNNAFKFDVRCYVYDGHIQFVIARLYQGQTTNFRIPGGGFASIWVET